MFRVLCSRLCFDLLSGFWLCERPVCLFVLVAGFPVLFMYFSRHLVPAFKSRDQSSVHVMTRVKKRRCCVCDSLEVMTNWTSWTN